MMKGYDPAEAAAYILGKMNPQAYKSFSEAQLQAFIAQAIEADMAYMHSTHVLNDQGEAGSSYYDDDDAFEYMLDDIITKNKLLDSNRIELLAALLDDYMDYQQAYLELKGLVDWE